MCWQPSAAQDRPLSDLAREYEPYFASGEINSEVTDKDCAVERVLSAFRGEEVSVDTLDGTTVSAINDSWWFNLRPSNTEPFLRFNGEAREKSVMELIRDRVLSLVRQGV